MSPFSEAYSAWATSVVSALPLFRTLLCLQVDCVDSLTFPTADVVKTKGRNDEALEQTPGSERDTHFVGDLRLPDKLRLWFGLVLGRSTGRLPFRFNHLHHYSWASVDTPAQGGGGRRSRPSTT